MSGDRLPFNKPSRPPRIPANVRVVSSLRPDDHRYSIADARTIRALSAAEDRHFWHLSRNSFIEARLRALGVTPPARILELGCGGGCVAAHLARVGFSVTGVDGHLPRVLEAAARAPTAEFIVHDLGQGIEALGVPQDFDVVGLFDVIEHLDVPRDALEHAVGCAHSGGLIVGTVPALRSLWSRLDEYVGHRLRYERSGLKKLLDMVHGAEIIEIAYFNRHLVPLLWLQRWLVVNDDQASSTEASLRIPSALSNTGLLLAARFERRLDAILRRLPVPGASLWFALRRSR